MKRELKTYDDLFNLSWSEIVEEFNLISLADNGEYFRNYLRGIPGYVSPSDQQKLYNILHWGDKYDKKE